MAKGKVSERHAHRQEAPVPKGRLLVIGGKERKGDKELKEEQARNVDFESEQILKFFVGELKGQEPLVVVVPTASTIPEEMAKEYIKVLKELGVKNVEVLDIRTRTP